MSAKRIVSDGLFPNALVISSKLTNDWDRCRRNALHRAQLSGKVVDQRVDLQSHASPLALESISGMKEAEPPTMLKPAGPESSSMPALRAPAK